MRLSIVVLSLLAWSQTASAQGLVLRGPWEASRVLSGAQALQRVARSGGMSHLTTSQRAARLWSDGAAWDPQATQFLLAASAGDVDLAVLRRMSPELADVLPQVLAERAFLAELPSRLGDSPAATAITTRLCDATGNSLLRPANTLLRDLPFSLPYGSPLQHRILLPGRQSWDSWAVATRLGGLDGLSDHIVTMTGRRPTPNTEVILRYNLTAPRALPAGDRHDAAELVLTASVDGGATWLDLGTVIRGAAGPPRQPVWSGSAVVRDGDAGKEILVFFTEGGNDPGAVQQIRLARSTDGVHYTVDPQVIVPPTQRLGYDTLSDADGFVKALRDPKVFFNPQTQRWEMLVATKFMHDGIPRAVIGRLVATDETLMKWRWLPPLKMSAPYDQIEVPNPIYRDGRWQLFVSTMGCRVNRRGCMGGHALEGQAAFRGYAGASLDAELTPLYGTENKVFGPDIYALSIFERVNGNLQAMGFYPSHMPNPDSGTALIEMGWDDRGRATFDFGSHVPD